MLGTTLFIVFALFSGILSQSVFDPPSYTEASCTGSYRWTSWFDTNDPSLTQGDPEMTAHIKQIFVDFMCSTPTAIEGQTSVDGNPTATGDVFRITLTDGFLCLNPFIVNYNQKLCADYKVRYCCPATTTV